MVLVATIQKLNIQNDRSKLGRFIFWIRTFQMATQS